MTIRNRFNIGLLAVLVPGMLLCVLVVREFLIDNAKSEVLRNAGLMMETALSVRGYTIDNIKPHFDPMNKAEFRPESIPAFAATEVFRRLQNSHPEYAYKEATLNPTNPRDRANNWERALITETLRHEETEAVGHRTTDEGKTFLYIARPIKITNVACLGCHTSPESAPPSMVAKYGRYNGFGWKLNDVIGAQIVYVPTDIALDTARQTLYVVTGLMVALVAGLFAILNAMLGVIVIRPLQRVSETSDRISLGDFTIPEFREQGATEIKQLKLSFNRMRRSIEKAMQHLKTRSNMPGI